MIEFIHPQVERADGESEDWIGRASFSGEEPFFADHFPGYPLVPGVLLFEIIRNTACQVMLKTSGDSIRFQECKRVRFLQPVKPPVELTTRVTPSPKNPLQLKGELLNSANEKVATASLIFGTGNTSE